MKNIRNYTSVVPAERSISQIETAIAEFGASDVSKTFEQGRCTQCAAIVSGRSC